jgi:hypothetical protein
LDLARLGVKTGRERRLLAGIRTCAATDTGGRQEYDLRPGKRNSSASGAALNVRTIDHTGPQRSRVKASKLRRRPAKGETSPRLAGPAGPGEVAEICGSAFQAAGSQAA